MSRTTYLYEVIKDDRVRPKHKRLETEFWWKVVPPKPIVRAERCILPPSVKDM